MRRNEAGWWRKKIDAERVERNGGNTNKFPVPGEIGKLQRTFLCGLGPASLKDLGWRETGNWRGCTFFPRYNTPPATFQFMEQALHLNR